MEIDTTNDFAVSRSVTGRICIPQWAMPLEGIPAEKALRLAAWITALVDPEGKKLGEMVQVILRK